MKGYCWSTLFLGVLVLLVACGRKGPLELPHEPFIINGSGEQNE